MKLLIAGFGSIGRRHFRNLQALGEKDILFLRSNKSTLPVDEVDGFRVEMELSAALAHRPDAVIIANPTALHLDVAIPAAYQGCHLFFEKPMSDSLERIPELEAALASGGGQVLIGFQFRFHPGLLKARELIGSGTIGKVLSARAEWGEYLPDWHPWEDYRQGYAARKELGGGVVRTLSHPLDYLHWLLGDVKDLWSFTAHIDRLNIEVEALAEIGMRFANGAIANVHLDYYQRPGKHTLKIVGESGTLLWDNSDGSTTLFTDAISAPKLFLPPAGFERNDLFLAEMKHFIDVAAGRMTPVCDLADGIYTQKLVEAVYRSNEKSRMVSL